MIYNCTPHKIIIRNQDGTDTTFEPCGSVARVETQTRKIAEYGDIEIRYTEFGKITGLPEGLIFSDLVIVSSVVAQAAEDTNGIGCTLVAPDTGPTAIRENGQIVAVTGFQMFYEPVCGDCGAINPGWEAFCHNCGI